MASRETFAGDGKPVEQHRVRSVLVGVWLLGLQLCPAIGLATWLPVSVAHADGIAEERAAPPSEETEIAIPPESRAITAEEQSAGESTPASDDAVAEEAASPTEDEEETVPEQTQSAPAAPQESPEQVHAGQREAVPSTSPIASIARHAELLAQEHPTAAIAICAGVSALVVWVLSVLFGDRDRPAEPMSYHRRRHYY